MRFVFRIVKIVYLWYGTIGPTVGRSAGVGRTDSHIEYARFEETDPRDIRRTLETQIHQHGRKTLHRQDLRDQQ